MCRTRGNDAAATSRLFASLEQWEIKWALGDAAYDSEKVRQTDDFPINRRNSEGRKDAYDRILPAF